MKNKRKNKFILACLMAICILAGLNTNAQNPTCETDNYLQSLTVAPSGCNDCSSLDDYRPLNTDSILYVRLNFHYLMINPTHPGKFKNATILEALATVVDLNNLCFDSLYKPQLRNSPLADYIKRPKIKFVFNSFSKIYDSLAYFSTGVQNFAPLSAYTGDPNAIDIIFKGDAANLSYGEANEIPGKAIKMNSGASYTDTTFIWWFGIELLAHELGHCLGLRHTDSVPDVCVNDYKVEDPSIWGAQSPVCDPSVDSIRSNNLMSYNFTCRYYMTPRQLARCHYNLRNTFLFNTLTPSSQAIVRNTQPNGNISITSNETWTVDRFIKGNITVKSNKTLDIRCNVYMTKNAKIIVENGGQLIIDGGVVTSAFGDLWSGIYLTGNPYLAQLTPNPNNSGAVLNQGMLRIKNGGTISQAAIGVRNYLNNTGNSGGIIFASNANFLNNVIDVQMSGQYMTSQAPIPSASWFYHTNFKTTAVIGQGTSPTNHVYLLNVLGVKFRACNFACETTPSSPGNGIYSIDATYSVDQDGTTPCVFESLVRGIYVSNINPLRTPAISNTKFIDNTYGAYFLNANYLALQTSTFTGIHTYAVSNVYLNNCKYYKINSNDFSFNTSYGANGEGVSAFKSTTGAHEIYRNKFSHLAVAINCMDDNGNPNNATDGLKMNCNDFNISPNLYDVVLSHETGLALPRVNLNQGDIFSGASATQLVRNIYGAVCGNENKWQIYSGSMVTYNHGSNSNTLTAVTQPTAAGCKSPYLYVVDQNIVLDYPNHCPAFPLSSGGTSTISSNKLTTLNDYRGELMIKREEDLANAITPDDFELQSTVASKLHLFMTDSVLVNLDSVTTILEANQGFMEDADIQTVFAYMNNGDYSTAQDLVANLDTETRGDWQDLLGAIMDFQSDTLNGLDSINLEHASFFSTYANSENMDGKAVAQGALIAASHSTYGEPHALPENESGFRAMNQLSAQVNEEEANTQVQVYPNPTHSGIQVSYNFDGDYSVKIELKDLLGKVIYTNFTTSRLINQFITLDNLKSGMYILSLTKETELIYTTKIVKVD